jgi:hypothetical protein
MSTTECGPGRDRRGGIAASLWASSILAGVVLGGTGAMVTLVALAIGEGSAGFLVDAGYAVAFGAGAGFLIGLVVGLVLGLLVTVSPRRARVRIMTGAIPLVAFGVSTAPIVIVGNGQALAWFGVRDITLTLAGAAWLLGRYFALEDRHAAGRVH